MQAQAPDRLTQAEHRANGLAASNAVTRGATRQHHRCSPLTSDRLYNDDEREFLMAMDAYRERTGKRFPTLADILGVLKSLGYRKS
jgi:hypothetical protein